MTKDTLNNISISATQGLTIVQTTLSALKAFIPAIAAVGGPIGMGISLAASLIPLISKIPTGGEITDETQAKYRQEVDDIISGKAFEGEEWKQSGYAAASVHIDGALKDIAAHDKQVAAEAAAQPKVAEVTQGQQL